MYDVFAILFHVFKLHVSIVRLVFLLLLVSSWVGFKSLTHLLFFFAWVFLWWVLDPNKLVIMFFFFDFWGLICWAFQTPFLFSPATTGLVVPSGIQSTRFLRVSQSHLSNAVRRVVCFWSIGSQSGCSWLIYGSG